MSILSVSGEQWPQLLGCFPRGLDLTASARQAGLLQRLREIRSGADFLRLILAYGMCDMSLRQVAAWAEVEGIARLSHVATLKQLRKSGDWLQQLVSLLLLERVPLPESGMPFRLRLVDATCVSRPGSTQADWRLHLIFDPIAMQIANVDLTTGKQGEALAQVPVEPNDLLIGDAGYSQRQGFWHVRTAGANFLIRLNWGIVPLRTRADEPFDLFASLKGLPEGSLREFDLLVDADNGSKLPVRLVALRKTEEATEKARRKIQLEWRRKKRQGDPRSLEAAGYVLLLTSLTPDQMSAAKVSETYRFRWQVELAFKRLKSLLHLDQLPAKDPSLARVWLYAKILTALLLDRLTGSGQSFFRSTGNAVSPVARTITVARGLETRRARRLVPKHRPATVGVAAVQV